MKIEDLRVNLAGISLSHPVMNAGGTCKRLEEVKEFVKSETAAVEVGSITIQPRIGNPGNVYFSDGFYSINSNGLPNPGLDYYKENLGEMIDLAHKAGKPLFLNIAAVNTIEEYKIILNALSEFSDIDLIILNCSCPNIWGVRQRKKIICYNVDQLSRLLKMIGGIKGIDNIKLGIKLSPILDYDLLERIRGLVNSSRMQVVITSNTVPYGLIMDNQFKPVLDKKTLGGIGGQALKPIALGQVYQLRSLLHQEISIIGVGGVQTGEDVTKFLKCGASAVQIATAYFGQTYPEVRGHNLKIFSDISYDYAILAGVEEE